MSEILFLAHRIPYPPDKGDKIRSYHLLRALAARHTVHLATFIDDPADWAHVPAVRRLCGEVKIRPLHRYLAMVRSSGALLTGDAISTAWYRDLGLRRWVRELARRRRLDGVMVFSSSMGPYADGLPLAPGAVRVMDFCDVDSDKWRQYAGSHRFPLRQVYAREARALGRIEVRTVAAFDVSLVISAAEERILRMSAGDCVDRLRIVPNGVDTDYFSPASPQPDPYDGQGSSTIVFTGAMDYHANVDGVQWFAHEVLPEVRRRATSATFAIVGSNPTPAVRALSKLPGVVVTGRVPDVRPYLAHAGVVIAPLRIARGVQNKVLEALAMAKPLVATDNAVQGIPGAAGPGVMVVNDAPAFADAVSKTLECQPDPTSNRAFVMANYSWSHHLDGVVSLFDCAAETSVAV
jgi:sugar transferase (PEP-CTERM/EpsH1 system associated)